ncbi:hypothetical protein ACULNC_08480 [Shigella flexneri]
MRLRGWRIVGAAEFVTLSICSQPALKAPSALKFPACAGGYRRDG